MALVLVDHPARTSPSSRMHRPDRLNAMSIELVIELYDALDGDRGGERHLGRGAHRRGRAFSSGLDLKDYGVVPNIDGLQVGRIAQRSMRHYSRLVPLLRRMPQPVIAAVNGPAYGGGMCLALGADLRFASAVGGVQQHRHRERAHLHRAAACPGCSRASSAWPAPTTSCSPAGVVDADGGARDGSGVAGAAPTTSCSTTASTWPSRCARFSPYGLTMTKDVLWANLEIDEPRGAVEIEDRNQLMLGFTENLPEAIRAFDAGPAPQLHRTSRAEGCPSRSRRSGRRPTRGPGRRRGPVGSRSASASVMRLRARTAARSPMAARSCQVAGPPRPGRRCRGRRSQSAWRGPIGVGRPADRRRPRR